MSQASRYRMFAATAPGLEGLLVDELRGFQIEAVPTLGGVEFAGPLSCLYEVALRSRIAEGIRLRLKSFVARDFKKLEQELSKLPFRAFLAPAASVRVKVVCHESRLWHSGAVEERALAVLLGRVGLQLATEESNLVNTVHLRLLKDEVQVSLDATGERMHRRGTRPFVEQASLRETLAAALMRVSLPEVARQEGRDSVLWDPFCGAGTIGIEALHEAAGKVAGHSRSHLFEHFRCHDPDLWQSARASAQEKSLKQASTFALRAIFSDRNEHAIASTQKNLSHADLGDAATVLLGDVSEVAPQIPEGAFIVTNPPYGKRLSEAGAMKQLLQVLRERPDLKPAVVLVGGAARKLTPVDCPALFRTKNGGMSVSARLLR